MIDSGSNSQSAGSSSSNQPQKVEVVVASPTEGDVNILGELAIFLLRVVFSLFMIHHGLEKLQDPQGFAEFVVGKYFAFLPGDPIIWTFAAGVTQILCPIGLALGVLSRLCALGLLNTMLFAVYFHLVDTGLEGFPFAVVEAHNYAFELSAIYAGISLYFLFAGPGRLAIFKKKNKVTYYPKGNKN
ncbi:MULTISPECIES: DoxX family protein [unclassified Prochlorococcus]|uniref:DoxX family protein n=1 Tax=unclassified Prochlorococcus TaxID=2627481 RepID=UPI000533B0D4|nr:MULTISPECIES: DoxX family protein [unclassified Prochlorococcus]KGG16663.1 putative Photosystem II reaction centre T prot [Prochlorococcus sp. MIT 0602]KGG18365.1 putative Photosystem II reaction centre T prot [Prochlorococcus sp. MIT 0603]